MTLLFNIFHLFFFPFTNPAQAAQPAEVHKCIKLWTLLTGFTHPWDEYSTEIQWDISKCLAAHAGAQCSVFSAWKCSLSVENGTCWAWFGWVWHLASLTVTISVTPTDSPQMSDRLIDWLHFYNRTSIVWLLKPPVQFITKDPILTFMHGLCCLFNEPY